MATQSKHSAKKDSIEYSAFENSLKKILSVPHSEIKAKLEAEKRGRSKRSSASRASNA